MKSIIGTLFFSGALFFSASIPSALAEESGQKTANSGFGAYFIESGHPGFSDPAQSPLLAYETFTPSELDNIEPAGGTGAKADEAQVPAPSNNETNEPVKE